MRNYLFARHLVMAVAPCLLLTALAPVASAQLEVTELMFDPASDEDDWEWIEIRNTGESDIDLDGYHVEGFGDFARATFSPNISSTTTAGPQNTVVPAGGLAILFNGFDAGYDGVRFAEAWPNIPASVPTIAVDFWPSLTNSPGPETIGFWSDSVSYGLDIDEVEEEIFQFTNAAFTVTYDDSGDWPGSDDSASIQWNGGGSDPTNGANWSLSVDGVNDASTSTATFFDEAGFLNSDLDFGSPGTVPAGPASTGLLITEVMYNPNSSDASWEWVEVLNNTGSTIDMAGYVFDDDDNDDVLAANIAAGTIADGEVAVLYNGDELTQQNMEDAWGTGINFIAVTEFTALTNGGDTIGIWSSLTDYQTETMTGQGRTVDNAVASLTYDNNEFDWPDDDGSASIYLTDLDGTNANGTMADGLLWDLAGEFLTDTISFNAFAVPLEGAQPDNSGSDVGSPGFFTDVATILVGDYNGDSIIDAADYTVWRDAYGDGTSPAALAFGDDTPGTTIDDYTAWKNAYLASGSAALTSATPEPSSLLLLVFSLAGVVAGRRR